jgi:DNA-binding MarR family transcriptional regulator
VTTVSEDLHELGEFLVSTAAAVVRRVPTDGMEVSLAAARVMARIQDNGPCRISDLAIQERSSQPTITNHIKRLEAAGLVQRSLDPRDARAWLIDLSPLGRQRLVEIRTRLGTNIEPMLEKLSARDRKALRAGLEVMQRLIANR